MNKQLLTVEFRYNGMNKKHNETGYQSKTITIGLYDTLEESVKEGNKALEALSKYFVLPDRFKIKGLLGVPDKLVTSYGNNTGVLVYAKINDLEFDDLEETAIAAIESVKQRREFEKRNEL